MRVLAAMIMALLLPAASIAQSLPRPHAELPSADQPARRTAITGYTLALIWMPEECRGARQAQAECRSGAGRTGFTLHGLWPDGDGADRWPQYCRQVDVLSDAELRRGIGVTPSTQLLQHEWAKHGSCMGTSAGAYFDTESALFRGLTLPDLRQLAGGRSTTAGDVQQAFARTNPALPAGAVRVHLNRHGYLDEIWLCLDKTRRFRTCTADQGGGADATAPVRIETGAQRGSYSPRRRSY